MTPGGTSLVYLLAVAAAVAIHLFRVKLWFISHFVYGHILLVAFLVSFILTPEMREFARKIRLLDHPGGRKTQREPVALLGGAAIYAAFALAIVQNLNFTPELKGMCVGATIIFLVGLLDDTIGLLPQTKLLAQIVAVLVMTNMGFWGGTAKQIVIIVWVVGITNAFNFLDGMDGLAAGLGAIASIFYTVLALSTQQSNVAIVSVALAGACLGFLVYNFRPATIYMGDSGSTLIGFLLAAMGVVGGWYQDERELVVSLAVPCLILGVLIFDMTMTSILRFVEGKVRTIGELLSYAGRDHVHHRLEKAGLSVVGTVLTLYAAAGALGLAALAVRRLDPGPRGATLGAILATGALLVAWMHRVEKRWLARQGGAPPDSAGGDAGRPL